MLPTSTEPRYKQIAQTLRDQIRSGEFAPGKQLPSFPQMRSQGVSQNTMEKVYALLEAEGRIERTMGRGVYVAQPRDVNPRPKTGVIGMPGQTDDYARSAYGEPVLRGVQDAAYEAGYDVLLTKDFELSRLAKMDGVVWAGPGWDRTEHWLPPTMPWVSVLWPADDAPFLLVEEPPGIRAAVRHLVQLGHRRIALIAMKYWPAEDRRSAYRESLREAGIEPNRLWERPLCKEEKFDAAEGFVGHGYLTMRDWLREDWKKLGCTAIFAHNDEAAVGVVRALREVGLRVPHDVSVVGFDGTNVATNADPSLTTVEVPLREIGAQGARLLLRMIENNRTRSEEILQMLPVRLRIGNSTAPPPQAKLSRSK